VKLAGIWLGNMLNILVNASASDAVTVWFSVPHSYNLYDPGSDTAPISSAPSAASVTLTLSNHPLILQLLD